MRQKDKLVAVDDPAWVWFWEIYPWRIAKLDARKAAVQCGLDMALMERIAKALSWQRPFWKQQGFGTPYPASYLRGQRWDDERPVQAQRVMSDASAVVFETLGLEKP